MKKSSSLQADTFVIALAYASLFVYGLADNGRGPIFPDILRDFALSDARGGLFYFTASGTALVNNLLFFKLMERKGPYWTLQAYSLVQGLGLLIIALAPQYWTALLGAGLFGTSLGGLSIAHNVLVSDAAPESQRRRLLAGLHAMYGVASLIIPLLVTLFYRAGLSWRAVSFLFAVGPAIVLGFSLLPQHKKLSDAHRKTEATGLGFVSDADSPLFPRKRAFFYSLIFSFYIVAEIGLSSRLALYARREAGFDVETANLLVAGFFAGLFAGRFAFAFLRFPFSDRALMGLSLSASFVTFVLGLLVNPLWLALTGLMMSFFYPVGMSLVKHETGRNASYVVSWCITVQSLWLMLMHVVMGTLSDAFGLGHALWIGPACLVLAFVALLRR